MSEAEKQQLQVKVISPAGDVHLTAGFPGSQTISIGRSSESDIHLADFGSTISRCHAVILFDGSDWEYYNLGANGSFRNGRKIESITLDMNVAVRLGKRGPILQLRPQKCQAKPSQSDESTGEISGWLQRVRCGDEAAAQLLWDFYADDIIAVARKSMNDLVRRVEDEEDIAVIAFRSFLAGRNGAAVRCGVIRLCWTRKTVLYRASIAWRLINHHMTL